VLVTLFFH